MPRASAVALALLLMLPASVLAAEGLKELTAALDGAEGQAEVGRVAAALEKLSKTSPYDYPETKTQLARACFLLGEGEPDKDKKKVLMAKALDAADAALRAAPDKVQAVYWRSMALLHKADATGGLSALGMVKDALRGLEDVSKADPAYDKAGAYRSWGKVLIDAPGWSFVGDKKKGLELLKKAKETAPDSLVNRLYLAQAYSRNKKKDMAREELKYIVQAPGGAPGDKETKAEAARLLREAEGG